MEKGILVRILSSIPIVGTALALWVEHTQMGMAQHGRFLGLLRGLLVGTIIAGGLLAASEAVLVGFEIGRFWINVHFTSHYLYEIGDKASRDAADDLNRPYYERHKDEHSAAVVQRKQETTCNSGFPIPACHWLKMRRHEKLCFLLGAHESVAKNHTEWAALFRHEWTFAEIIDLLDAFYANGAHADVPVIDGLRIVRGQ